MFFFWGGGIIFESVARTSEQILKACNNRFSPSSLLRPLDAAQILVLSLYTI